ncbi:MAG: hypothetical protein ACLUVA_04820 [Faecalibacterium sp.]
MKITKRSEKGESKNRPVATNFQFLKMLCPSGTALLQRSRVSEVFLLGRACPKPCWERVRQTGILVIVYFFILGAISSTTVTRTYKPYSNQVMVLFQGKLISGWFTANIINATAIISITKPTILDALFFM